MPHESLCYFADSQFAPYGSQSSAAILQRSEVCCDRLIAEGVKAIVVACNTATAAAAQQLRSHHKLPIIAMEPAIKPAAASTRSGRIGVLATAGTLSSEKYERLLRQYASHVTVYSQPCHGLVEEIEKGDFASPVLRQLLDSFIAPLIEQQVDTLILGCTHYPLIRPLIAELAGDGVEIVDSGAAVARRVHQQLLDHQLLNPLNISQPWRCWTSGDPYKQKPLMQRLIQHPFELLPL